MPRRQPKLIVSNYPDRVPTVTVEPGPYLISDLINCVNIFQRDKREHEYMLSAPSGTKAKLIKSILEQTITFNEIHTFTLDNLFTIVNTYISRCLAPPIDITII